MLTAMLSMSCLARGGEYKPNWQSLDSRPVPEWWKDAKFGIFIHWGVYAVPAWCDGWYAEWYYRLMQGDHPGGGPGLIAHHKKTWGEDFRYPQFAPLFKAEKYDPEAWAELFRESGAGYVVLTSKHHEGFCLWDAPDSENWNAVDIGPKKDLIAPLAKAVRNQQMRFGLYYSLLEWDHGDNLPGNKYPDGSDAYVSKHVLPQMKDLVKKYQPSIIWPDGEWTNPSEYWRGPAFLAWYLKNSDKKDDVVWNDRWGKGNRGNHGGFYTTEYGKDGMEGGAHPWEESRGIGGSYGYNSWYEDKDERYPDTQELLDVFVSIISRGGNFLLNVGPKADGTIIEVFQDRLRDIGRFLDANGEAVYGSRLPYKSEQGENIKFTRDKGNKAIFAFVKNKPGDSLTLNDVYARKGENVVLLSDPQRTPLEWSNEGGNLAVTGIDKVSRHGEYYWVFKIPGGFTEDPDSDLAARWSFDNNSLEKVRATKDEIQGNYKFMPGGVRGACLRFDGFTTCVVRKAQGAPRLSDSFTFSAWVAIGAYPWNRTPILSQQKGWSRGYYFGLDHKRRFGLQLSVDGTWVESIADKQLEMRQWYHLAATYDPESGIALYLNGKEAGQCEVTGKVEFAPAADLHIGRNHEKMLPVDRVRAWAKFPSWWAHDGMYDEIKIHNRSLSAEDVRDLYQDEKPEHAPDIPARSFPDVSGGLKRFGAYPANLEYYEQWDALWQMAGKPDIVVKFDQMPVSMVFWKGTHFAPCWVTENGKWMADQSLETGAWPAAFEKEDYQGAVGCSEHMSDTECRFTHAKIVENNDARVVVHWRYAMTDCNLNFVKYDEVAGQGQWGDEFYYIYPDAIASRHVVGWWPERREKADQETIFLSEPGTRPEDNCRLDAITLVGWEGQSQTYSWKNGFPRFDTPDPVIQMVNLKSDYKPYMVFGRGSKTLVFGGEVRKDYSHFPWWNHYPVARAHSDGRYAEAPDRAAHSSLSWIFSSNGTYLYGMTDKPAKTKLALARSWISPPTLEMSSQGFQNNGYDQRQRAYLLERTGNNRSLKLKLSGTEKSPVHNPAFVIENWGDQHARVRINGKPAPENENTRIGRRYTLESADLVIWLKLDSSEETNITLILKPANKGERSARELLHDKE